MQSGLYTSASGMITNQHYLDIVTNNLANLNTTGFKKEIPFVRELENAISALDAKDEYNKARNAVVKVGGSAIDLSPGVLKSTGNKLDLAISGDGFFAALTQNGVRYTKAGSFTLSRDRILQTMQGYPVLNDKLTEIRINGNDVNISEDGSISVDSIVVDKLVLYDIPRENLIREGENLFATANPQSEPLPAGNSVVHQGFLEMSNVNAIEDMIHLIELTKEALFHQKMITATMDTTTQRVVNQVGVLR